MFSISVAAQMGHEFLPYMMMIRRYERVTSHRGQAVSISTTAQHFLRAYVEVRFIAEVQP